MARYNPGIMHHPTATLAIVILLFFFLSGSVAAYPAPAVLSYNEGTAILGNISILNPNVTQEKQALSAFNDSIGIAPDYYEAWNGKADVLNRLGYYGDALEASNRSLAINSSYVPAWINRGTILYTMGFQAEDEAKNQPMADLYYNEQITAFRRATELEPGNAVAWFNLGFALAGMNRYDEAISAFDRVRSINPAYPHLDYYVQLAQKNREAEQPVYVKYSLWIIGGIVLAAGAGAFLLLRKRSPAPVEEGDNRKARRRKEQKERVKE
jgi:tetratricopeptide (TPR) repeat protein